MSIVVDILQALKLDDDVNRIVINRAVALAGILCLGSRADVEPGIARDGIP